MQIFTGANGRPLDAAHPGLPPYARRALDRLRQKGVLILAGKYWKIAPGMSETLKQILSDDKELDSYHLADKYLKKPTTAMTAEEADETASALEEMFSSEEINEIVDESEPAVVVPVLPVPVKRWISDPPPPPVDKDRLTRLGAAVDKVAARRASSRETTREAEPEEAPEEEGEELPFPFYVAKRFDMLSEELDELRDALPSDTKAHLEGLGMHLAEIAGDVKTLTDMFLNSAALVEKLLDMQKEDHAFLMILKTTLAPKISEEKDPNVKHTA